MSDHFKNYSNKKSNFKEQKSTMDTKHKQILKSFDKEKKKIPKLKNQIKKIIKEYQLYKNRPKNELSNEEFDKMFSLEDQIKELKKKLTKLENDTSRNNYYTDAGGMLFNYYQNIQNVADDKKKGKKSTADKGILSFFGSSNNPNNPNNEPNNPNNEPNNPNKTPKKKTKKKINRMVKRADIREEYLRIVDPDNAEQHITQENYTMCSSCNREMTIVQTDGMMVCQNCGIAEKVLIESDRPSYKEPPREISYFAYKRINHFIEWLNQSQAKETTIIPEIIFDKIREELKKERISKSSKITSRKIKTYLKKLGYSKYYEHAPHIINRINGVPPLILPPDLEEKLKSMFREVQEPYLKVCPKNRKNFLSYSYTIYKFLELLGFDEYKKFFPLLKSREKIHAHDAIWKKICKILQWQYIPSI